MGTATDIQGFVQLIEKNKAIIYKVCNLYCRDQHKRDDLAQEIIYNLWKSYQKFNPDLKFTTWMYRIALNVAISFYREQSKSASAFQYAASLPVFISLPEAESDDDKHVQQLLEFINQLKEVDRSIILLYLDEKTNGEIAAIVGISVTNVSTKVNRIKEKLRNNFKNISNKNYGTR